ncbi:MAG: hypothetical protein IJ734_11035 [Fibrobacter sp.]|nr:hypothetical protein [Fibrobacter sp.]
MQEVEPPPQDVGNKIIKHFGKRMFFFQKNSNFFVIIRKTYQQLVKWLLPDLDRWSGFEKSNSLWHKHLAVSGVPENYSHPQKGAVFAPAG